MITVETERLIIRPPVESDRARFVELFTDEEFTVFSDGVHDLDSANERFDGMLRLADLVPYAKQPIIEKATGMIVGYSGVGTIGFEGIDRLEWGWRLTPDARGHGYATEATNALLSIADGHDSGEMLCIIDATNEPSRRVAEKVGFAWWKQLVWDDGIPTDLLLRPIGAGGDALQTPSQYRE